MKDKRSAYIKRVGIAYLLALILLIIKGYKNYKTAQFYTLTTGTLLNGTYNLYDDDLNIVGKIQLQNEGEILKLSIHGEPIEGCREELNEPYSYPSIDYKEISMTLRKYENEFYYCYDTGESVLLVCLLRSWFTKHTSLEKLAVVINKNGFSRDRQVFMVSNIDYETYQFTFDYPNKTIQNHLIAKGGMGQLYRCFFIQEDFQF